MVNMIVTGYMKHAVPLLMLALFACGCGQDEAMIGKSETPVKIGFCLAPDALAQADITRIELRISISDSDEALHFRRIDIDPEERNARETVLLPIGESLTFSVRAFDMDHPVLSGLREKVVLGPDENEPVVINLSLIQTVIGVRIEPEQNQVKPGDTFVAEIYVSDAYRLAVFTCELGFDRGLLELLRIEPGDLFGEKEDCLFLEANEYPESQENRIALAIARKAGTGGISGSGNALRLTFEAKSTGIAYLEIQDNDKLILMNDAFEEIKRTDQVKVEPGMSVRIE
jgi:hypothetical protein